MPNANNACVAVAALMLSATRASADAAGNADRGARAFQTCAACHTLEPGRHMTGPSLGSVWGRKAAGDTGFHRYSDALKRSGIVWNEASLDKWLANPDGAVPGNLMAFKGVPGERARADLIALLRAASEGKAPRAAQARALPDLKKAPPAGTVSAIRHCGDSYFVTNGANETRPYWEFNLRFKTDASPSGPEAGKPVLVGQGMQGDRAQVVFSKPAEISAFIREGC
jgi:cytochrome c